MTDDRLPTVDEVALAGFLHDIGKLWQRAAGEQDLPETVRNLEGVILPKRNVDQRYTHRHALFTAGFFQWLESEEVHLPRRIGRERTREASVYHHAPDKGPAWAWLVAEADRLSSGMDRTAREIATEADLTPSGRDAFRRVALQALPSRVALRTAARSTAYYPATELVPEALAPAASVAGPAQLDGYRRCWDGFRVGFRNLAGATTEHDVELFHEGLMSLSERFMWAVPSSTVDQPDVSLHDHALSVAAIAGCLQIWHAHDGSLEDAARIRDRATPKFRLLEGDLSGIQSTLFRLARQQVKGVNRILRARSFLLGSLVETATLLVRQAFRLPPYAVLQRAGGKFLILLPAVGDAEGLVDAARQRIDRWLAEAYAGDLALNLALGPAFGGQGFLRGNWPQTYNALRVAAEAAKLRPLSTAMLTPVLAEDYEDGAEGACPACGVRPRKPAYTDHDGQMRCRMCHQEALVGRKLVHTRAVLWKRVDDPDEGDLMPFDAYRLVLPEREPHRGSRLVSAWQFRGPEPYWPWPPADRFIANHVPTWDNGEWNDRRYADVPEGISDIDALEVGAIKTMAYLAHADREPVGQGFVGRPMLAVLKVDVDRLGQIFGRGLGADRTIGRVVALSRLIDAFFTGWLTALLRTEPFRDVYTVYAGGDDLLLIGPWRRMIELARELRAGFRCFTHDNPDLTLSAAVELLDPDEPLTRAVERAEQRLEAAKDAGRDRICLISDMPIEWPTLDRALDFAQRLNDAIRDPRAPLPTVFVYKLLHFAGERAKAEAGDSNAAIWRPRLGYHLARAKVDPEIEALVHELLPPPGHTTAVPARIPITIALYRNR
ncbi:MAG: type III-A CRISPR-associated protein Cas10/Csm1 [Geminicoccaceae bacterium]